MMIKPSVIGPFVKLFSCVVKFQSHAYVYPSTSGLLTLQGSIGVCPGWESVNLTLLIGFCCEKAFTASLSVEPCMKKLLSGEAHAPSTVPTGMVRMVTWNEPDVLLEAGIFTPRKILPSRVATKLC